MQKDIEYDLVITGFCLELMISKGKFISTELNIAKKHTNKRDDSASRLYEKLIHGNFFFFGFLD